ncbi:hypothetical protein HN953_02725 [Candidatus Woesearchaeota archaeon]|nr:hypothetical protein [Candidatus Woesearchaeota archaeon]
MFKGIKNVKYFSKGKRSLIYTGIYKNQKVGIKTKNPKSEAKNRIKNEIKFLKILNKYKIGPKILIAKEKYFAYKFVEGELLIEYLKNTNKKYNILKKVLDQCRTLDKLKINKLEFTRPIKHVFVKNNKITMIDFERCYETKNPKNVTQFSQYIIKNFKTKKEFQTILKNYKEKQTEKNYKEILKYIKTIFS